MNQAPMAQARAQELAEIAALAARCAGMDLTITPCPEVLVHVGDPPVLRRCAGVRFDDHYLLVQVPTGTWRALKIDPDSDSVVLRLGCTGGYRAHMVRILTALIYDRLKAGRDQFEPRVALLGPPAEPVEVRSVPYPPVVPSFEPKRKRPSAASPQPAAETPAPTPAPAPVPVAAASPPLESGPEVPTQSAPSPEPAAPAGPAPAPRPAKSAGPPAAPAGKARPLAGRARR